MENGCFLDIYSFGIMMLVVLSEEKEGFGIYGRASGIYERQDIETLKEFFKMDWADQVTKLLIINYIILKGRLPWACWNVPWHVLSTIEGTGLLLQS